MIFMLLLIFLGVAGTAAAFVIWPIWRAGGMSAASRVLLACAAIALVLGIGGGVYLMQGTPLLAVRSLAGPRNNDLAGLISRLAWRVRDMPQDTRAWVWLGRGYLTLNDPSEAAAAFKHAALVAPRAMQPMLFSAYGTALTQASSGEVTPEAEAAFHTALAGDPKDPAARFYLGVAAAARRDNAHALALWEGLLADAPAGAPWRGVLVDRIAQLRGSTGTAPDVSAMVAGLAARLKAHPADPDGWQRLVRAYAVLGNQAQAHAALADARVALKSDPAALAALGQESKDLKLEKGKWRPQGRRFEIREETGISR
jgi:cytochrome c-type biogenesis protein CcmH